MMKNEKRFTSLNSRVFPSRFLWALIFSEETVPLFRIYFIFTCILHFVGRKDVCIDNLSK